MAPWLSQIIVAQAVTADTNDKQRLEPMLKRCEETNGELPENLLADAGYWSEANAELKDDALELLIATSKG